MRSVEEIEEQILLLQKERNAARAVATAIASVQDYAFVDSNGKPVRMSALFGSHDELLVIHNMGERCQYCALWADGLSAFVTHMQRRAALVLATPDSPESARKQIALRGWKFPVICDRESTFAADMGFEAPSKGDFPSRLPGVSAFHKENDGTIARTGAESFGPGDGFCSIWNLFPLLKGGEKEWKPIPPQTIS